MSQSPVSSGQSTSLALASVGQRQLWMHDHMYAHDGSYNISLGLRFVGELNVDALDEALNAVIARHEPLRTSFSLEGDDLYQVIADELTVHIPVIPLDNSGDDPWAVVNQRLACDGAEPFDLDAGPLLRATLYRLGPADHTLTLILHHTVFDGWSVGILLQEMAAFYNATRVGGHIELPELEVQYADFAEWQREQLAGPAGAPGLSYWRRQLVGAPLRIELPTDRPPRGMTSRRGRLIGRHASPSLRGDLGELCRKEGVTLFMVLMSGFAAMLHRYAHQADLLIGTPVAGRTRRELEPLVGYFVNTVLIRSRLEGDATFRQLLTQLKQTTLDAQTYQDVPFDQINEIIHTDLNTERPPLLQVMLALQSATPEPEGFAGLEVSLFWGHSGTSKYDLFLNVIDDSAGLRYELEYDVDLFDEETANRLLDSYGVVLEAVVAAPGQRVSQLPLIAAGDVALMERVNATAMPLPDDASIHALFEAQVRATPDHVAVVFGDRRLTYAELDRQANVLARELRRRGRGPGDLVGLCVTRSEHMVAAVLGILKAGAAYVPIDPHYPADRIALVLEDADAATLITETSLLDVLPGTNAGILCLDRDVVEGEDRDVVAPVAADLAYVIYTSGSTGRPKGVEIPHRAVVNFLLAMQREPGFTARDVLLAVTTLSFDIAGLELLLPLVSGGTVVVATQEAAADPVALRALLERHEISVMQATPVTWRMLIESGWTGSPTLRVLCGGEAMPADLAAALIPRCAELWNMYGPTETTIWSLCRRLTDERLDIGRPIANTDVVVVDDQMQPTPVGVPGELLIGGEGLARGYHKRPDLTAERFVDHPLIRGARAYRTGDVCRWHSDGNIDYIGRLDHQVKVRGFRIELGEIETVLSRHPDVRQGVVAAREDTPGDRRLVAYVTVHPGTAPSADSLRTHLEAKLPEYMVPAAFVVVERFTLTPNGKIDRKALPVPSAAIAPVQVFVEPRPGTEAALADIWKNVLGVDRVGATDNFFHLGGHSLMAIRLFGRIREVLGVELPFGLLLQHPTVSSLAAMIDRRRAPDASGSQTLSALTPLRTTGTRPPLFFTHGVGGEVWSFTALTRHLGDDQPVYGLQPVEAPSEAELSVPEIATRYIKDIRAVAPHGPYMLAGHCAGAAVAFEMARQLHAAGEQVGLVAVMDYWFFDTSDTRLHVRALEFVRNLPLWIRDDLSQVSPATIMGRIRSKFRIAGARLRGLFGKTSGNVDIRDQLGMWRFPDYQVGALERAFSSFQKYRPQPYDGDILLIKARTLPLFPVRHAPDMGWGRVVRGTLTVADVRGSHETILHEPLVAGVADVLREAIDRVIERRDA